jgi:hypothetical protein
MIVFHAELRLLDTDVFAEYLEYLVNMVEQ